MSYKDIESLIAFLNYSFLPPDHISRPHLLMITIPLKNFKDLM